MAYDLILRRKTPTDYSRGSNSPIPLKTTLFQLLVAVGSVAGSDYYRRRQFNRENAVVRDELQDSLNLTQRLPAVRDRDLVMARRFG